MHRTSSLRLPCFISDWMHIVVFTPEEIEQFKTDHQYYYNFRHTLEIEVNVSTLVICSYSSAESLRSRSTLTLRKEASCQLSSQRSSGRACWRSLRIDLTSLNDVRVFYPSIKRC